jgi:E3 ubiquitin-protein ligase RNF5
MVVLI